ncbi:MAG: PilZ domain-containing protein [Bradyrhizobium sp.]|uniref:PilZ domain-containing protein n=1 Tax=Bradyrhizobium sp. TaxID=376 RepID=UPI0025C06B01|nr:PilZ domain-containing protein [Bradyrhizobium sp.]MBI5262873.1 PilZ domain-containing protein [Bradyrhizobium sp.]
MKWNSRKAYRVRFEHKCVVNLMGVDGTWRRQCLLMDVSATGARLEVEGSIDVLQAREFFLVLSSTGLAFRRCELVWVEGMLVGVKFISSGSRKRNVIAVPKSAAFK